MDFEVVFDLAQSGYRSWWFPAYGIPLVMIGALLVFAPARMQSLLPSGLQGRARRVFSWFFLAFALVWTVASFVGTYREFANLRRAFAEGSYRTVEGPVRNFHPMPSSGHAKESFDVQGAHFEYSDYVVTSGFNNTASHGGPVTEGLYVRIAYVGNAIVRLEIKR